MVKSELIARMAQEQSYLAPKDVELAVNLMIDRLAQALTKNERIEIRGFGSFTLHYRPPRQAHNPKTGERVYTQAKYSPHFKPGKELRDRVQAGKGLYPIKRDDAPAGDEE
jgi:integration host factor subunit beta